MDSHEAAWAAGLIEGEGSFVLRGTTPSVRVTSTDFDVLERLQRGLGGNIWPITKRQKHWKNAWLWDVSGRSAIDCINNIHPYLLSRRKGQAEDVRSGWRKIEAARAKKVEERYARQGRMLQLRGQGLTHREIADKVGVDRSTVSKLLRGTA